MPYLCYFNLQFENQLLFMYFYSLYSIRKLHIFLYVSSIFLLFALNKRFIQTTLQNVWNGGNFLFYKPFSQMFFERGVWKTSKWGEKSPVDEKKFLIQFIWREILWTYTHEGLANGEECLWTMSLPLHKIFSTLFHEI